MIRIHCTSCDFEEYTGDGWEDMIADRHQDVTGHEPLFEEVDEEP